MNDKLALAERIAAGLSKAERQWVQSHPADRFHADTGTHSLTRMGLEEKGILTPRFDQLERDFGHTYTRFGLGVWDRVCRTHLQEQST